MSFYECNILTYLHTEPLLEVLSDLKTALYIRTLTGNKFKISGYTIMTYTREGIMSADGIAFNVEEFSWFEAGSRFGYSMSKRML